MSKKHKNYRQSICGHSRILAFLKHLC